MPFLAKGKIVDNVWNYSFLAFPYALVYSIQLSNGIMFFLLGVTLLNKLILKKETSFLFADFNFLSILFYLSFICVSYSSYKERGFSLLETRLPLIVFPIIVGFSSHDISLRKEFLKHFLFSLVLTFFVTICIAIYRNINGPGPEIWFNKWYYHYSDLTEPINIDPLYLSLFVGFGILVILVEQLGLTNLRIIKRRSTAFIFLALLSLFLVILGVRSILFFVVLIICLLFIAKPKFFGLKNLSLVFLVVSGIVILSFGSPVTRQRFQGLFNGRFEFSEYSIDRLIIWDLALSNVKNNFQEYIIGGGTATSVKTMEKLYLEKKINWNFEQKTNTHNQYIEFLLDTGLIGLMIFFCFLFRSAQIFLMEKDYLGFVFLLVMVLAFFAENYLNRQKGVAFFSVFHALFYFTRNNKR